MGTGRVRVCAMCYVLLLHVVSVVEFATSLRTSPVREEEVPGQRSVLDALLNTVDASNRRLTASYSKLNTTSFDEADNEINLKHKSWDVKYLNLKDFANSPEDFPVQTRAELLGDAFHLARDGKLPYDSAFALAEYLSREKAYEPWSAALSSLTYLNHMLNHHEKYLLFKRYVLRLLDKPFENLRVARAKTESETMLWNELASWACCLHHPSCSEITYDASHTIYSNEDTTSDFRNITSYAQDERRDATYLNLIYSKGTSLILHLIEENYEQIKADENYKGDINNILINIASSFSSREEKTKMETFLQKHEKDFKTAQKYILQIIDKNVEWTSKNADSIFSALEDIELRKYRLPDSVTPRHYALRFTPYLENETFHGEMTVYVTAQEDVETIVLHSQGIGVLEIVVEDSVVLEKENLYNTHSFDTTLEFLNIHLKKSLQSDRNYNVHITYNGTLRDNMYGFYISSYIDNQGNERKLAATQFQPTHARKAFPCFDEPKFKATFSVSVRTPPYYHALGNMPEMHTRVWDDGSTESVFLTTPLMSTYLVAFVVSDFVALEDKVPDSDVVFRTWCRPNALSWAEYSRNVSRPILEELESYTSRTYIDHTLEFPFDKVDQVALPDFSAGAMENWGLVTYRETALLYNAGTAAARKSVATIIAHELTHMWFGNLVTTRWWDATWLNEAFAQYFQFVATSRVKPLWRLMDQFLVDHHQAVMAADALAAAAALTAPAYTPAQVSARFGTITYSKGAAVLKMISFVMGEKNFQNALQLYLREFRYSMTVPEDLFKYLIMHSHDTDLTPIYFEGFLRCWTEKPGFPVLQVQRLYEYGTVVIRQKRFLLTGSADTELYFIPLTWVTQGNDFSQTKPQGYLLDIQVESTVPIDTDKDTWIIFNVQSQGYYRVNYDERNWELISTYLKDESKPLDSVHVLNRAQLLDDAFNLARAGQLPYATAFALSDYLRRETDYVPWTAALTAFAYLQRMLIHNAKYSRFQNYVRHLLEVQYDLFGFEDREEHVEKLLLSRVASWACSLRHAPCTDAAAAALQGLLDHDLQVAADLRSVVYCYGIRHSSSEYWEKLLEEYKRSLDNAERALIMAGLACSHDEGKLEELLGHSISGKFIRKQDASNVFSSVYSNSVGVAVALDFLDENFEQVFQYYGAMGSINNIVVGIAGRLTTQEQKEKMQQFVSKHSARLEETGQAALEIVDENLSWLQNNEDAILSLLEEFEDDPIESTTQSSTEPTTTDAAVIPKVSGIFICLLVAGRIF